MKCEPGQNHSRVQLARAGGLLGACNPAIGRLLSEEWRILADGAWRMNAKAIFSGSSGQIIASSSSICEIMFESTVHDFSRAVVRLELHIAAHTQT
mmetsp:Transcript_5206/g.15930  ORF Transcript_5206/g.15930 Transcript_5206/m.15930 type:complete len:96 (+) Transcript_5206:546-833(+)